MIDKEFEEKCLSKKTITIPPTCTVLKSVEQIEALTDQHNNIAKDTNY